MCASTGESFFSYQPLVWRADTPSRSSVCCCVLLLLWTRNNRQRQPSRAFPLAMLLLCCASASCPSMSKRLLCVQSTAISGVGKIRNRDHCGEITVVHAFVDIAQERCLDFWGGFAPCLNLLQQQCFPLPLGSAATRGPPFWLQRSNQGGLRSIRSFCTMQPRCPSLFPAGCNVHAK